MDVPAASSARYAIAWGSFHRYAGSISAVGCGTSPFRIPGFSLLELVGVTRFERIELDFHGFVCRL